MELPSQFGAYLLLKQIGKGATGEVFLGKPTDPRSTLPSPVVVKLLRSDLLEEKKFVSRFRHEAVLAIAIDSPNVAKVLDTGSVGQTLYIVMEYIRGWTLARVLEEFRKSQQYATVDSVADVISGALLGLITLHGARDQGGQSLDAVHRDLSPKNIMIGEDGVTRLIDLGLGKSKLLEWRTRTGAVMGSPGYMTPEQVAATPVDHRSDLYTIGIVLWELLTLRPYISRKGKLPEVLRASLRPAFRPPSSIRTDLPDGMDDLLAKALALDPEDRFQSSQEFLSALRKIVPERPRDEAMQTLLGEMLWEELSSSQTEVIRLLSEPSPMPGFDKGNDEATQVFAQRSEPLLPITGRDPTKTFSRPDQTPLRPLPVLRGQSPPFSTPAPSLPPIDRTFPPASIQQSVSLPNMRSVSVVRWLPIAVVPVALFLGMWIERARHEPDAPVPPAQVAPPLSAAAPALAPQAKAAVVPTTSVAEAPSEIQDLEPIDEGTASLEPLEPSDQKSPTSRRPRRSGGSRVAATRHSPSAGGAAEAVVTEARPPPQVSKDELLARVRGLTSRALAQKSHFAPKTPQSEAIDQIVAALLRLSTSTRLLEESGEVERLSRRLASIEKSE